MVGLIKGQIWANNRKTSTGWGFLTDLLAGTSPARFTILQPPTCQSVPFDVALPGFTGRSETFSNGF
jgi:hypothetical protein